MRSLQPFFLKLELRDRLSDEEKAVLAGAIACTETYGPGQTIVPEGVPQSSSRLLLTGMVGRSKTLPSGARQFTELHIAGDFVDLHSFLLKELEHDVVALSPVEMAVVPHEHLRRITETEPHLTRVLWLTTLIDASIHRQWIVSAGRRSAVEQMAHLFCELLVRLQAVGLSDGRSFALPLTQQQISDVCGLSPVHVNRVAQELRQAGLVEWSRGEVTAPDFERLAAFAQFDPAYLVMHAEPR